MSGRKRFTTITILFALIILGSQVLPLGAQGDAAPAALSDNVSTFATGLIYPRGLEFGPDGNLYVAEAGSGGETESMGTCEDFTSMFVPYRIGMTARVSMIDADGNRTTVVENLPSAQDQYGDVLGAHDIAFVDDTLYVLASGGGCSRGLDDLPTSVVRVLDDGSIEITANLSAFYTDNPTAAPMEEDWEPDGAAYSMVVHDDQLYVVNANHAAFDMISLEGDISRLIDMTVTEGHVTPTAATVHEGSFYIGTLGEFPIRQGASKVYRATPDGAVEVYAEGLTAVLSLAFDDQGRLYVLETSTVDGELPVAGAGRVVRLGENGELEEVATGLTFPTGMTFGPDGELYVTQYGYGGDPTKGEIVRIDVSAPPSA